MLAAAQLGIAQMPAADDLVTVLVGTAGILGVVDVHGLEAIESHHAVELGKNAVEVVHDVVPAVGNMTGIQAHAEHVGPRKLGPSRGHPLDDARELLERAAHLSTLARHRLEQHARALPLEHHLAQGIDDELDASVDPLPHVRAGMKVVALPRQRLHALQVLGHRLECELARPFLGRARVVRVGRVRHQTAEPILIQNALQSRHIIEVERLGVAAAWVTREKGEGVRADGPRGLAHGGVALGGG